MKIEWKKASPGPPWTFLKGATALGAAWTVADGLCKSRAMAQSEGVLAHPVSYGDLSTMDPAHSVGVVDENISTPRSTTS